jgi:site-specific DNA-methyltransferase (adenine-specific)
MSDFTLHLGDCLAVMRGMPDNSVDAIVTDPPYHLTTGKKGGSGKASESKSTTSPYSKVSHLNSAGFMGMKWDGGDIAQSVELWTEAMRVLKPGGHLLAFSGSRTYHRMACAIEDAGAEIRDQIMWVYGSGFPKSLNLDGDHAGWGTALKPAHEPICVARKPLIGTVASNVLQFGTGALNIDGCRVGDFVNTTPSGVDRRNAALAEAGYRPGTYQMGETTPSGAPGRWPANLIHDGSDEVIAAFPTTSSVGHTPAARGAGGISTSGHIGQQDVPERHFDTGSAARFFYSAKVSQRDRNEGLEGFALHTVEPLNGIKTSVDQRAGRSQGTRTNSARGNFHPTVKPTELMRYLVRLVTPPGGVVLDPFMGSGSTGKACMLEGFDFIGIELTPEYLPIAEARILHAQRTAAADCASSPQGASLQPDLFEDTPC